MYKKERSSILKTILRTIYTFYVDLNLLINLFFIKKNKNLSIYFGGAYAGNLGGTLVKIRRLKKFFKEKKIGFNILYLLSNSIYHHHFFLKMIKKKIPVIHNQNGVFYKAWYDGDWKNSNLKMANQLHIADYVFYQSNFCKFSADKFLGKRKKNYEILYNACDIKKFKPYKKKKINKKNIQILMTGTYRDYMLPCLLSAIRATNLLRKKINVKLNIEGKIDEKLKTKVINYINNLDLNENVYLNGEYNQESAPKIYQKNDLYYFMVHNAPCPNALIEAIASGLPVVYLDSGSSKEIVRQAGIGIKSKLSWNYFSEINANLICKATIKILNNYNFYSKESRKNAIKHHDIEKWIIKHKLTFNRFIS